MKAPSFEYAKAESVDEALELLGRFGDDAKVIAGGQSLVPALNMRLAGPSALIDIGAIGELRGIKLDGAVMRIGALTRHCEIMASGEIARHVPLLAKAVPNIAHEAIRNRGTIGGSLANADPAAEWPACSLALGAVMEIAGQNGRRKVSAADFFQGYYTTAIEPDEILIAIEFPVISADYRSAFMELSRRKGDYAMVGLAAHARVSGGVFNDVRLSFFNVADRPVLAVSAAAVLEGKEMSVQAVEQAQQALGDDLDPLGDLYCSPEYKIRLARVLTGRVLSQLAAG
ncbi:MAG: xanthine dehydrogenase family protein subunit M [Rhodospirillales bacterium]|nr:xanthine dehydrogenase family protein subunit M [Rhodospirillales bacterium]MCW8952281.1 xanthine dehydrogenase family protein subunit M [Rhodospirillales bacterium]MCW8971245.1 xanthine dehydrogenase family protein subunit M [Rhodospirillales bacterium]MCW9001364.1 xanthine dehydrogenase family protein subunit M [Rhodospirillales bacterium]